MQPSVCERKLWGAIARGAGAEPSLPTSGARKTFTVNQDPKVLPLELISCSRADAEKCWS